MSTANMLRTELFVYVSIVGLSSCLSNEVSSYMLYYT